jgi:hypothetical protein
MALQAIAAGVGTAIGLGQAIGGAIGMPKAKREAFKAFDAQRTYKADPEVQKMLEMRRGRLGMGLGSASRQIAEQGIASSAAQATSAAQQMGRGAGLSAIGAIQKQSQRGATQLAAMDEQAREQNLAGFERAVGAASSERARQFASESEKEQARTAIRMQQLASKRQAVSQGLSGAIGSATGVAMSGAGEGDSLFSPSAKRLAGKAVKGITKMGKSAMSGATSPAEDKMFLGRRAAGQSRGILPGEENMFPG